jgi:hypothetical protein
MVELSMGGGWITTKYYLRKAQIKVHAAALRAIPFQEIPTTDLDGSFTFNYSKILMFLLEMFQLDHSIVRDPTQPPVELACTLDR